MHRCSDGFLRMTCNYFYVRSKPFTWRREAEFVKQVFDVGGDERPEPCEIGKSGGGTDDFEMIGWFPVNDGFYTQSGLGDIACVQLKGRPLGVAIWEVGNDLFIWNELF